MSKRQNVNPAEDITVIIRAADERTESTCQKLLADQVPTSNIKVVRLSPFSAALKKSYEIGLEAERPWTLVADADILVRPGIINDLALRACSSRNDVFAIQTEMLDKFFGGQRVGGLKLYRTELLDKAIAVMRPDDVRPEGAVIKRLHAQGLYVDISDLVCGLHDFEQSYDDIFRKGFVHALKHSTLTGLLLPYWQREAKRDKDFEVLLAGYELGSAHDGQAQLAKDEVKTQYEKYRRQNKLAEKPALNELKPEDITEIMENFVRPPEDAGVQKAIEAMGRPKLPSKGLFGWFGQRRK